MDDALAERVVAKRLDGECAQVVEDGGRGHATEPTEGLLVQLRPQRRPATAQAQVVSGGPSGNTASHSSRV